MILPPTSDQVCRLYADFVTLEGLPIVRQKLRVFNLQDPESVQGFTSAETIRSYETDDTGHVQFDVLRGLRLKIVLINMNITRVITVPAQPTANLLTIPGDVSDAFSVVASSR